MKKVLAVVIAVAFISIGAVYSNAQVPNISVYFDDLLQDQQDACENHFAGEVGEIYVVMNNFNTMISTVEFGVDWGPGGLLLLGENHLPGAIFLGLAAGKQAPSPVQPRGVTITYPIPHNAFGPFICMTFSVFWTCEECPPDDPQAISVVPHEGTGDIIGIEWQTFRIIDALGWTSLVCPGSVAAEETSWGRVKALY
jgi:hypothetical protein